ncbi:hypothetical protein COV27_02180 [candidate division WWE3 bacterium CG10_big_fil_rev_8_21_14_0_10_39_14]|nr:MAG: hypothetical protein COV27_02180 [candidate division WWE3 bacterium CG10_big_fil_rev_8_21_14_0_10_39_14]
MKTNLKLSISEIKEMKDHYERASEILEDIESKIVELLKSYDDRLGFRDDSFEPLYSAGKNELIRWHTSKGEIIVKEDGSVIYTPRKNE